LCLLSCTKKLQYQLQIFYFVVVLGHFPFTGSSKSTFPVKIFIDSTFAPKILQCSLLYKKNCKKSSKSVLLWKNCDQQHCCPCIMYTVLSTFSVLAICVKLIIFKLFSTHSTHCTVKPLVLNWKYLNFFPSLLFSISSYFSFPFLSLVCQPTALTNSLHFSQLFLLHFFITFIFCIFFWWQFVFLFTFIF